MNAMIATITYCIVGCNTGSPDHDALKVLECDTETGAAKIVQSVSGCEGTTYFQLSRDGRTLYSAIGEKRDEKTHGTIVKFDIENHRIGKMTKLAELPCETPCHIALSPDEGVVSFAAYLSGTCGAVGIDGSNLKTFVFPNDDMGDNKNRQQKAYAHQTFHLDPNGAGHGEMGVVDLGCDRVWFFDPKTMKRRKDLFIKTAKGDGPRHALFLPRSQNKVLYLVNELGSSVSQYAFDGAKFTLMDKTTMLPDGFSRWAPDGEALATKAAAIKTTADGKIIMASNRGHDSIAFYEVGTLGKLKLRNIAKLTGKFPRDFELMPGEKFMVVGHKMSNEIQIYAFDRAACSLSPVGEPIPCWRPLCFEFMVGRVIPNAPSRQLGDKLPQ